MGVGVKGGDANNDLRLLESGVCKGGGNWKGRHWGILSPMTAAFATLEMLHSLESISSMHLAAPVCCEITGLAHIIEASSENEVDLYPVRI